MQAQANPIDFRWKVQTVEDRTLIVEGGDWVQLGVVSSTMRYTVNREGETCSLKWVMPQIIASLRRLNSINLTVLVWIS